MKTLVHTSQNLLFLPLLTLSLLSSATASNQQTSHFKVAGMKAMLFYEDKGTFSADVSDVDNGPPYSPPRLWNTPIQYENRSSSVLVTVEVAGEPEAQPERRLEFTARYLPLGIRRREVVVRKIVTISIPTKLNEKDNFHAGFWLYNVGCDPVRLTARIIGPRETSTMKRVIRFDCGE
jgi:hypothetical protein